MIWILLLSSMAIPPEKVRYIKGNPHIKYDLDAYDDAIVLNVHGKDPIIPITNNGELLFCNGNLYRPKPDFIKNFLPLFLTFADKKGEIVFRNDLMNSFPYKCSSTSPRYNGY